MTPVEHSSFYQRWQRWILTVICGKKTWSELALAQGLAAESDELIGSRRLEFFSDTENGNPSEIVSKPNECFVGMI